MKTRFCLFVLCLIALQSIILIDASDTTANSEVVSRSIDTIKNFLSSPLLPSVQSKLAFKSQLLSRDQSSFNETIQLIWSQLLASDSSVSFIYVSFTNGMFVGYRRIPTSNVSYEFVYLVDENATCSHNTSIQSPCRNSYSVNEYGNQKDHILNSSIHYDPRNRTWYEVANKFRSDIWSDVYAFATTNNLGITYATCLFDSEDNFIGVAGVDVELVAIMNFLIESYYAQDRWVYIIDSNYKMIASSTPNDTIAKLTRNEQLNETTNMQLRATESPNSRISGSMQYLLNLKINFATQDNRLVIYQNYYIQTAPYYDSASINWTIVIMRNIKTNYQIIEIETGEFYCLVISAIIIFLILTFGTYWVWRYKDQPYWKSYQSIIVIQFSSLPLVILSLLFIGENTDLICGIRQWLVAFSLTILVTSFFYRLERIYSDSKKIEDYPKWYTRKFRVGYKVFYFTILIILLIIWSIFDPYKASIYIIEESSAVNAYQRCGSVGPWGLAMVASYILGLFLVGSVVSYKVRKSNQHETRRMLFAFNQVFIIIAIVYAIGYGTGIDPVSLNLAIGMMGLWIVLINQILILGPSFYEQFILENRNNQSPLETDANRENQTVELSEK